MQRILVIDDDDEIRSDVIDILKFKGFITEGAINGKIGLQAVKDFHPDLILCDFDMPELDGYGVLEALNKDPELRDISFIRLINWVWGWLSRKWIDCICIYSYSSRDRIETSLQAS
jgi:CheY-like chemotaxis protein